jgi:AAA+ superfamily predicted ATPase
MDLMGFAGSDRYLASGTEDGRRCRHRAGEAAAHQEPGTGKTVLAEAVAESLGAELISWHIKSTTKAQQGLYEYDAVARLRDSQLGDLGGR